MFALTSSQVRTFSGSRRYCSKRRSSSLSCSSVTGISSELEDNSSQSSTASANLSAVESFCSSGILSLIIGPKATVEQSCAQPRDKRQKVTDTSADSPRQPDRRKSPYEFSRSMYTVIFSKRADKDIVNIV